MPTGLILDQGAEPKMILRHGRWFAVTRTVNGGAKLVAGSDLPSEHLHYAGGERVIPQWATAISLHTRIDATGEPPTVTGL